MEIETFDPKEYYLKKCIPYLLMLFSLAFYGFPFKFPHNTFNWIQKFNLPFYAYPIFVVLFIVTFILMIASFFNEPSLTRKKYNFKENRICHKGTIYKLNDMLSYKLEVNHGMKIENTTVWRLSVEFETNKILLYLILSYGEKREFENFLEKIAMKKAKKL